MCSRFDALVAVAAMELRAIQDKEEKQNKKRLFFFKNRNWGSSPALSSLLHKDYYKFMEMETPQRLLQVHDSCLTENKGTKRPAVSHGGRKGGVKKAKVHSSPKPVRETPSSPKTMRETPSWLVEMIKDMNGEDPTFIFEKKLTTTDVNPSQGRLLIPFKGLMRNDFLTQKELSTIQEDQNKNKMTGVGAMVVDSRSRTWNVSLRTWNMKNPNYSFTSGWNQVVKDNELGEGDNIGLWSFRTNGTLCFALVRLT